MERLWHEIAAACEQHNCYRVLGIAHTSVPVEVIDGFDLARIFRELDITDKYRIAWVECNEDARDVIEFIETVLFNRGLPGKVFDDEAAARNWLLES